MARRAFGSRLSKRVLGRGVGKREPRRSFLVVCEGAVTEREYIDAVKSELRYLPVDVEVIAGNPNTAREIVARAVDRMRETSEEAKRLRDSSLIYDEVWCVFDGGGEHPHEKDARIRARDNGIYVATSSPSIELWILLHLVEQNAFLTSRQALSLCHRHKLMSDKHLIDAARIYREFYDSAAARSRALRSARARDGNHGANPSTDFDLLIDSIRKARIGSSS
jgi:hypothetical protein